MPQPTDLYDLGQADHRQIMICRTCATFCEGIQDFDYCGYQAPFT